MSSVVVGKGRSGIVVDYWTEQTSSALFRRREG